MLFRALWVGFVTLGVFFKPALGASSAMDSVYGYLLQGDAIKALEESSKVDPELLSEDEIVALQTIRDRFSNPHQFSGSTTGIRFMDDLHSIMQSYWHQALTSDQPYDEIEQVLYLRLMLLLKTANYDLTKLSDMAAIQNAIIEQIRLAGFHTTGLGRTESLLDLMIWKQESIGSYQVSLIDRNENVDLVFTHDYLIKGWLAYATANQNWTGGWSRAKDFAIYCVAENWDLDSEEFSVSLLKHEAQHFVDQKTLPHLDGADLEYRAKLTEIAFADETLYSLLDWFEKLKSQDRSNPHAYANRKILNDIAMLLKGNSNPDESTDWSIYEKSEINAAARLLFEMDTDRIKRNP